MANANFTPDIGPYTQLKPFRFWCQKVLPLVYDDSLSYYELLGKVVDYLNKTMEDVDTQITDIQGLLSAYEALQGWVNAYYTSADFAAAIDDGLDRMAESGQLTALINAIIAPQLPDIVDLLLPETVMTLLPDEVSSQIGGTVATQLPGVVSNQIPGTVATQLPAVVSNQIGPVVEDKIVDPVEDWLDANVSGGIAVDRTLSVLGAGADAAFTGARLETLDDLIGYDHVPDTSFVITTANPYAFNYEFINNIADFSDLASHTYKMLVIPVSTGDKYCINAHKISIANVSENHFAVTYAFCAKYVGDPDTDIPRYLPTSYNTDAVVDDVIVTVPEINIPTGQYYDETTGYLVVITANIEDPVYKVADEGLRKDISDLKSDLSDVNERLDTELPTKLPFIERKTDTTITETQLTFPNVGALSDTNGSFNPSETAYNTSDYIPLEGVTGIYRTGTTTMFALWTYAFYNENQTLLGFKHTTTDYTIETYDGKQVTWLDIDDYPTAKYIRITIQPSRPYTYYTVKTTETYLYDIPEITIKGTSPLPFYKKKIVNFGDSIFGNFRDRNDTTDKSISKMIADATGATVYNCGFGGCRMSWHSEHWRAFSMFALADAITTGVWTEQDAAISASPIGMPSYFAETLALLKSIDFTAVDYITIGYGVNDFTGNVFIDAQTGFTEKQYFKGALDYSLRTILTTYPNIKIIDITPCWMWFPDTTSGLLDYDSDDAQAVNTRGLTLPNYVTACKEVCEKYHVPCIDTYSELGFNPYSYTAYFNVKGIDGAVASDGTHPKQAGRQLRADRIIGSLNSLY